MQLDLRSVVPNDLVGFEGIIHLAALSNDPLGSIDPLLTYDINFGGSIRLAVAAKEAGVQRFLFSSSCSLYGKADDLAVDEAAPLMPMTPYAETKAWFERALFAMADDRFSPTSMRNATAHGWSPRLRGDLVVHDLLGSAVSTGQILIKSDGSPWRPLVHVEDICGAFLAALDAPLDAVHRESLNVGRADQNFQVREIAEAVAQVVPESTIAYAPGGEADKRDYKVDFSKMAKLLPSFEPKWTLKASVEDLYRRFVRAGITRELLGSPVCTRLARIRQLLADSQLTPDLKWVGT
jgi:nucleoside-diphosphate-sugar epimerase